jgi:hypothetical protein
MNMRQLKRSTVAHMTYTLFYGALIPQVLTKPVTDGVTINYDSVPGLSLVDAFREAAGIKEVEQSSQKFVVVRKKDGEIVGEFNTEEEALAEIEKAKRAKKAALIFADAMNANISSI